MVINVGSVEPALRLLVGHGPVYRLLGYRP